MSATPTAPRRLYRSTRDAKIAGVAGGIAEYFGWDPTAVRLAFALSIVLPGPQVLIYLIAWIVLPRDVDVWRQDAGYPPHGPGPHGGHGADGPHGPAGPHGHAGGPDHGPSGWSAWHQAGPVPPLSPMGSTGPWASGPIGFPPPPSRPVPPPPPSRATQPTPAVRAYVQQVDPEAEVREVERVAELIARTRGDHAA